jgi:hypothetical protein
LNKKELASIPPKQQIGTMKDTADVLSMLPEYNSMKQSFELCVQEQNTNKNKNKSTNKSKNKSPKKPKIESINTMEPQSDLKNLSDKFDRLAKELTEEREAREELAKELAKERETRENEKKDTADEIKSLRSMILPRLDMELINLLDDWAKKNGLLERYEEEFPYGNLTSGRY